jgi:hypothetical protein
MAAFRMAAFVGGLSLEAGGYPSEGQGLVCLLPITDNQGVVTG